MLEARLVDSLPFESQDLATGEFELAGRRVSAAEVIERLLPHLTDNRIARIDQVIEQRTNSVAVVVEHIYDIGNISAVMRSAESFGFLPFHIVERLGSKYKMSDRISRGTEKWLDIRKYKSGATDCFKNLRDNGYKIYATDLDATTSLDKIDLSQKVAVVMGNEHEGISAFAKENADGHVKLPMFGFAQSFNISVAAALTFSQIHEGRRRLGRQGDLTAAEKQSLRANYFLRTLQNAEVYFKN